MPDIILKSLKGKKNFNEVFESGKRVYYKDCSAVYLKYNNESNPSNNRIIFYAVLISKKTAKKAVVRNRIKRLMKESMMQNAKSEPQKFDKFDVIVLLWRNAPKRPAEISLNDVKPVVDEILNKIGK